MCVERQCLSWLQAGPHAPLGPSATMIYLHTMLLNPEQARASQTSVEEQYELGTYQTWNSTLILCRACLILTRPALLTFSRLPLDWGSLTNTKDRLWIVVLWGQQHIRRMLNSTTHRHAFYRCNILNLKKVFDVLLQLHETTFIHLRRHNKRPLSISDGLLSRFHQRSWEQADMSLCIPAQREV